MFRWFAERHVLSSLPIGSLGAGHRVIELTEAEQNLCWSVERNLGANTDTDAAANTLGGLFKGYAPIKAERKVLETYAQLFVARCDLPP